MDIVPTRDQVPQMAQRRGPAMGGSHRPGGPSPAAGITGQDILRILRKRWLMITISVVVALGVTLVATALWMTYAPQYKASAYISVDVPKSSPFAATSALVGKDPMEILVMSQAPMVKSRRVLQDATQIPDMAKTNYFSRDPIGVIARLEKDVAVSHPPNTNLIEVSISAVARDESDRNDLATVVNAIARAFVTDSARSTDSDRLLEISNLQKEKQSLESKQASIRDDIRSVRTTANQADLRGQASTLDFKINTLTQQLTSLGIAKAQAQAGLDALRMQEENGALASSPEVLQALDADPKLRSLKQAHMNLVTERDNYAKKLGPEHRTLKSVEARLESVTKEIAGSEKELIARATELMKSQRELSLAAITAQLTQVQTEYDYAMSRLKDLQNMLTTLEDYTEREKTVVADIKRVDSRLLELRALSEKNVNLRQSATTPTERSMPKWSIMAPMGFVLGLVVGLGLAFLLEFIDTSVKTPSDVTRRLDMPLLGMIPHTDDLDEEIADLRLAFMSHPNSLIGEGFRQVRTCLQFSGPSSTRRSLLITSPLPEDGRTTVTMNLAASIAHGGRKVLVVDTNFRQPAVSELFKNCPDGGLSNVLTGQAAWRDLVYQVQPTLAVMAAGILPPNPAELLGSDEMRRLIEEMTAQYDHVLFDGAPCLVVSDAPILSTLVDGTVLVVRAGSNTYGIVQRARDTLHRVGAHLMGVVLDGVRVTAGGYLRKNYETFYEYHGSQAQVSLPAK